MEQTLDLINKKQLTITGIDEVVSFDEKEIVLKGGGDRISIKGENLSIKSFDGEMKKFESDGIVISITYKNGISGVKKLFK